jgi:transcriptional regulator with XRE-family HTH domain
MIEAPHEALRRARLAARLPQGEVAKILKISAGYLADIEYGRRQFPEERLPHLPEPIRSEVKRAIVAGYEAAIARVLAVA